MARTKPTIPVATFSGGGPPFSITDDAWQRIEAGYGFPLRASVRQKIFEATVSFLLFAQSEQAALPISVAREHIERVKKSAADFFKTTLENSQDSAWDAPIVCSTRILKQKHRSRIFQNISSA
jgi:hypothetical protein